MSATAKPPAAERQATPPPQDLAAEEYVLGAMMISPHAIDAVIEIITARDFFRESHGLLFDAILSLYHDGMPADVVSVADRLHERGKLKQAGGRDRLREIATLVPAASAAAHHAAIVREIAVLRELTEYGYGVWRAARDRGKPASELVDDAERLLLELVRPDGKHDPMMIGDTIRATIDDIEAVQEAGGREVSGLATGFKRLDEMTSGLQAGNLIVVAGRPSMGKTALALCIAANVAIREELPVALFTLEMSRQEVERRLLCSEGLVESQKLNRGTLDRDEWGRIARAGSALIQSPIIVDDSPGLRLAELRSKARRLKMRHPSLSLIIVDYLQLMSGGGSAENRVQEVSQMSRGLKVLAGELGVPVVAMSQLSRDVEKRHDKRPMLSDLRESGAIEQDSDVVIFVYRDEYYHPEDTDQEGIAEVSVAKQRNGPVGIAKLAFVKRYARFSTLERGRE